MDHRTLTVERKTTGVARAARFARSHSLQVLGATMPREQINPFKPDEVSVVNELLDHVTATKDFADKCERCGLNVSETKAETERNLAFLNGLKKEFFPNAV